MKPNPNKSIEQKKCFCMAMTCKEDCKKNHTHKDFFCEKCQPERYEETYPQLLGQEKNCCGCLSQAKEEEKCGKLIRIYGGGTKQCPNILPCPVAYHSGESSPTPSPSIEKCGHWTCNGCDNL